MKIKSATNYDKNETINLMKKSLILAMISIVLLCSFSSTATAYSVNARITSFDPASDTYHPGDSVSSSLSFKNTGRYTTSYLVSYSVQDENGKWYDTPLQSVRVSRRTTTTVTSTWTVPDDALSGEYNIIMNVYNRDGTTKLTSSNKNRAFTIINELEDAPVEDTTDEYRFVDNFDNFNSNNWIKSSFTLGLSTLDPANVDVNDGNLRIKLPANTLNGGEIKSVDLYKYGTYSARMKIPNAPSSTTSFLMYLGPDFYNEIDMVVQNDNSGNVHFTTYANGKMQHSVTKNMGFDPTNDYHDYKFEFEQGILNFYVDDKLLQTWTDGMTTNSMHLIVQTLYPQWLEGKKQTSDQYLLVDWIKIDEAPVDEAPVDEAPVDEAPVDEAPVDEAPVDEAPVDDTPVDDTPVDEAPVDDTPVDDTPVDEAPVDEAPVDEAPVDDIPVKDATASTKEAAIQMTTTLENSQTDPAWNYAENIGDGRGITFGCIGFCTGTYDGNILIKYYTKLNPDNTLAKYIPALDAIDAGSHTAAGGDGNPSTVGLDGFINDVENCDDPLFKTAQVYQLDQLYWNPAQEQFNKLGYEYALTQALLYDASVRLGPDGMQSLVKKSTASNEIQFCKNFISQYTTVLRNEGLGDTSRMTGFTQVLNSGNYNLVTPYKFTAYGEEFTITGDLGLYSEDTPVDNTTDEYRLVDNFDSFNSDNWVSYTFAMERSTIDANNVDVKDGNLRIKLPANTLDGGEIQSTNLYKYGTYSARMKMPDAPSSITGFFMYLGPDVYNQIDIEVYNDDSGKVDFTTWVDGKRQHTATMYMGFDPTEDFHEYKFDFEQNVLNFYVDGELMQSWTDGMTTNSMYLLVNAWYPQWLPGTAATSDQYLLVDWIKIV